MSAKGRGPALLPTVTAGNARSGRAASSTAVAGRGRRFLRASAAALALLLLYKLVAYHPQDPAAVMAQQRAARASMAAAAAAAAAQPWDGYLPQPPPKVALLFLVRGAMPLEPLWREFFRAAAQVEPVALPPPWGLDGRAAGRRRHLSAQDDIPDPGLGAGAATDRSSASRSSGGSGSSAAGRLETTAAQQRMVQGQQAAGGADTASGSKLASEAQPRQGRQQQAAADGGGSSLTPEQEQQLAAQRQLWISLSSGEAVREARRQAMGSRTMEAPYSMMSPLDPQGLIARQDLFSVYVHTLPGFHFGSSSIFSGYQADRRVFAFWGQYSVAEAERRLLFAALADLRNQRFVLLSETCTPLYPPHVLYSQLLGETKSRVNACARPDGHVVDRWQSAFYIPGLLTPARWRKSSQWKALLRSHAELVAADTQLAPRFERECYSYQPPTVERPPYIAAQNRTWVHRSCIADEHYVPTLLAAHQLDSQTTCADSLTAADWLAPMWSPKVHLAEEVDAALIRRLRKQRATDVDCDAAGAAASAAAMFRRRGATATLDGRALPGSGTGDDVAQQQPFLQLGDACYLFARKFGPEAVPALLKLATDCASGTGLAADCLSP